MRTHGSKQGRYACRGPAIFGWRGASLVNSTNPFFHYTTGVARVPLTARDSPRMLRIVLRDDHCVRCTRGGVCVGQTLHVR
jgi:hypothetical protein